VHPSASFCCRDCRQTSVDPRWTPLCPACYEKDRYRRRRVETRPPALEPTGWADSAKLLFHFEQALGPPLP
jgi:hypothetical protein